MRQGDSLSRYLFIMVGDVLAELVRCQIDNDALRGIIIKRSVPIPSNLFFVYDTLFLRESTVQNCRSTMGCIEKYCQASGKLVNFGKSSVIFSRNVLVEERQNLADVMQISLFNNVGNYLGPSTNWDAFKSRLYGLL